MTPDDSVTVRSLVLQLGYDIPLDEIRSRFDFLVNTDDHVIWVADLSRRVIGFLHAFVRPALEKPREVVVQAMAVDRSHRRSGVGKILMDEAEAWAIREGYSSIVLASHIDRDEAHTFYEQIGFESVATSRLLRKKLCVADLNR